MPDTLTKKRKKLIKQKLKNSKKSKIDDPLAGDLTDFISEGGWLAVQFELKEKKDKVVTACG